MQKLILRNNIDIAVCIACNTVVLHIKVSSYLYYKLHYVHTDHEVVKYGCVHKDSCLQII